MCGIIGFKGDFERFQERFGDEVFHDLIYHSSIRGVHSFGFSFYHDGILITFKDHNIHKIIDKIEKHKPSQFIFHNRYSTTGDYKDHDNNQPVTLGETGLVFNGVISQATKEENEFFYGLQLKTDNDGEILLRQDNKEEFLKQCRGSIAGLMLEKGRMYVFRNIRRPLWKYEDKEFTVFASTKDIFMRSNIHDVEEVSTGYQEV